MVTEEPKIISNAHYGLVEAAKHLGVHPTTLVRWTKSGLVRAERNAINGRRFWTGKELARIWKSVI